MKKPRKSSPKRSADAVLTTDSGKSLVIELKTSGSNLSRSEVVTVRLDPKLRYLAELAARKQRRTLSSYIEGAIEESLANFKLNGSSSATECSQALWDVDASDR